MKWIKKIFKKTKKNSFFIYKYNDINTFPIEVLTTKQINNALNWYKEHKDHVDKLIKCTLKYPPTLEEDKNDCRLWKSEHWKWFIYHQKTK